MQRYLTRLLVTSVALLVSLHAETPDLRSSFTNPPPDTRPGCYWYWIKDNVSKEGITKDLEAMARVGIGRAYIGHIFGQGERWETQAGNVPFMSDAWWEAVQWAVKEADRVGVEIGFFNSPGWSQSGGPWVKPSQSMRYIAASETVIEGGKRVEQMLPVPEIKTYPMYSASKPEPTGPNFTEKDFQDVRVIAFQQPETESNDIDMTRVKSSFPTLKSFDAPQDDSANAPVQIGPKAQQFDLELDGTVSLQSLRLDPIENGYVLTCEIAVSDDGKTFREVSRHVEERGRQGPRKKDPMFIPFPETKSKYLRLTLSSTNPASFSGLALSRRAVVSHHVRKQLAETSPSGQPLWNAYAWDAQPGISAGSAVDSTKVIDLSDKMDASGRLAWDAPPGRWVVMRSGMVPTGAQCGPASPQSRGLEVDKMSKKHVRSLFDGMVGEFLRRTPASDRKALKYVIADSYETGPENWTDGFAGKFEKRFGYSPVRFLPCLTGRVVDNVDVSTRFLWDWRRLIAESIATEYVGGLRDVAHENGLILWLENYGHWGFPSEFLLYGSMTDQVGGEFWEDDDPLNEVECRAPASCSHIYGRADTYAEAFTSNRSFEQSPFSIKNWCDWVYSSGINHFIFHVYIHQPDERKPGIIASFGTAFNRHNTWFEQSKEFIDYTRRSSVLLKAGLPVIDVAYYIGENAPSMRGPRTPVLPDGYDYDYINSDVLIHRATVKDGRITVPNGPSYSVLVLPQQTVMRPEVADAIRRLVRAGANVIGPKPLTSPSLAGFPQCDIDLANITEEIWGAPYRNEAKSRSIHKTVIPGGDDLAKVLGDIGCKPDVQVTSNAPLLCAAAGAGKIGIGDKGGIVFKHRSAPDREIYFLSNTTNHSVDFTASLRVNGRKPELWNANSGAIADAVAFTQRDGRTHIPLHLAAAESIYVVFSDAIAPDVAGSLTSNSADDAVAATLDGPWAVRFEGESAPKETVFTALADWTQHADDAIRHFSGTGVYEANFTLAVVAKNQRSVLSLGKVADIASVVVNGKDAGIVWTTPWELDISGLVKPGANTLQIRVVNQWHNRLIADADLPPDQRVTHISQIYRPKQNKPLASGLIGPVRVLQSK